MADPRSFRASAASPTCAVCGASDSRTLASTKLATGTHVTVCGSHALAHARAGNVADSVAALRALVADKRDRRDRREPAGDELARSLSAAFSLERRGPGRRVVDA